MGETKKLQTFKVNLEGVLDVLANHLYSSEQVFIRELLQNACDAIAARQLSQTDHEGKITLEVINENDNHILIVEDNGIGLKEHEVEEFLSSIGSSTKREYFTESRNHFIGQFGIGLLSCFMICDNIVLITKAKDNKAIKWTGNIDGSYEISILEEDLEIGTKVYIKSRNDKNKFLLESNVLKKAKLYGEILPYKITFVSQKNPNPIIINERIPVWQNIFSGGDKRLAIIDYGVQSFDIPFQDYIEFSHTNLGANGVLFIYPFSINPNTKIGHKVFLKKMLLGIEVENIVPDWCFFIKCVINVTNLRPTASRESLYEDDKLEELREAIGNAVKYYIKNLASSNDDRFSKILAIHQNAFKQYALIDDDFFELIVPFLDFQATNGNVRLKELMNQKIYHIPNVDEFRKVAPIAQAKNISVLNSGYMYDARLLSKINDVFENTHVEVLDVQKFMSVFDNLTEEQNADINYLSKVSKRVLAEYQCTPDFKIFSPESLTTIYFMSENVLRYRHLKKSIEKVDTMWADVLSNINEDVDNSDYSILCYNYSNQVVQKMSKIKDEQLLESLVLILYVNSLNMGYHTVTTNETIKFNQNIIKIVDWISNLQ